MSVTIHCPNQTLTYRVDTNVKSSSSSVSAISLLFGAAVGNEHKSIYPALIVERLVHGILYDDPILCTELSCLRSTSSSSPTSLASPINRITNSVRSLQNYVGCIRELGFCEPQCTDNFPSACKWVTDLLNLEQWVSEFKLSITSSFTKTNMAKSVTKVTIKFPFSAHVGGQLSSVNPISSTTIVKRKYDDDNNSEHKEATTTTSTSTSVEYKDKGGDREHVVIPQHAYQFVYRCFQDSLPGKKETSARDNSSFEFSFLKDKYPRRDQVETAVEQFVTKYQSCIGPQLDSDGECSLVWTIGGEDTLVVFPSSLALAAERNFCQTLVEAI